MIMFLAILGGSVVALLAAHAMKIENPAPSWQGIQAQMQAAE